jgi:drug/metabolite transporter (DMT)-like permease
MLDTAPRSEAVTGGLRGLLPLTAFVVCTVIWGSTWLGIKIGYEAQPPLDAAATRFAIAAAILLVVQILTRLPLPRGGREWGVVAFTGVVLVCLDYALIYWAEQYLETGLTSVLFAMMPLFTLLLARALGLETLTWRKFLGIAVSIGGVAALSWEQLGLDTAKLLPVLAVLGAALCSAATTTVTKKWGKGIHSVTLNAFASLLGAACLTGLALTQGHGIALPKAAADWGAVLYLAVFGSVIAFLLYFWLLKHWDATRAGMLSVLTPVIAVVLGSIFRSEPLTPRLIVGTALVLTGVVVATTSRRPKKGDRPLFSRG